MKAHEVLQWALSVEGCKTRRKRNQLPDQQQAEKIARALRIAKAYDEAELERRNPQLSILPSRKGIPLVWPARAMVWIQMAAEVEDIA